MIPNYRITTDRYTLKTDNKAARLLSRGISPSYLDNNGGKSYPLSIALVLGHADRGMDNVRYTHNTQ